ncbi:NB-ARC domain-containing protein [Pseudonocardia xinjiangensis]|uniref:NB-ARC domain-containing protein n=1 Tax=Pseudonocardia xinjiangensis TaxID=75289 RepID=UPI003D8C8E16
MEQDLRANIRKYLVGEEYTAVLSAAQAERATLRRGRDSGLRGTPALASLLPYLDFADAYEVLLSNRKKLPGDFSEQIDLAKDRLQRITAVRNRVAHTRPMEIDDLSNVLELARELASVNAIHWDETRQTLEKLGQDSSYVLGLNIDLPVEPSRGPMHNLPVPDFDETGFFGRKKQVARIKRIIKGPYPVVSILGDGGIGKTSVALKVAYELLDDAAAQFDSIVWVTAKATVLSANEIRRVNDAIEDSLGLFVKAAGELGGQAAESDPIEEVLAYLATFRVLLILDNLETVLDQRLREFLLDLPLGSKVMLTSRIGAGVENPVQLEPLSLDESHHLLRTVARIREVGAIHNLDNVQMGDLAGKMGGHPLYIKWFVSGVQAGQRPEELLSDNSLLLDFCMSNVFGYLSEDAQVVVQCMQVVPDEKRQAEVAFLAELDAERAQAALLQLLTTNFVQMESQPRSQGMETAYQLSEFGRTYLDKQHPVSSRRRRQIQNRFAEMRELGWRLQAENTASPYDPHTVNVRDAGDFSTARLLRDALIALEVEDFDGALGLCHQAQVLSPMYSESWRVEALVQTSMINMTAARHAYERALELDPTSAPLNFLFGRFLSDERVDIDGAVRYLRRAAQADPGNPAVLGSLAWALLEAGKHEDSAAAATHSLRLRPNFDDASFSVVVGLRAYYYLVDAAVLSGSLNQALELLEAALEHVDLAWRETLLGEGVDRLLQLRRLAIFMQDLLDSREEYAISKALDFVDRFDVKLAATDPGFNGRHLGKVRAVVADKLFGFIRVDKSDYFFHLSDLINQDDWSYVSEGMYAALTPNNDDPRGNRGTGVRLLA